MLTEREERIVAWLYEMALQSDDREERSGLLTTAVCIQRGDHLAWRPSPTIPAEEWLKKPSCG